MKISNDFDPVSCPRCGNDNLHQGKVRVWCRTEDSLSGTTVTVDPTSDNLDCIDGTGEPVVTVAPLAHGNPSRRRQGLSVEMMCEHCAECVTLTISQHKGSTYIEWQDKHLTRRNTP